MVLLYFIQKEREGERLREREGEGSILPSTGETFSLPLFLILSLCLTRHMEQLWVTQSCKLFIRNSPIDDIWKCDPGAFGATFLLSLFLTLSLPFLCTLLTFSLPPSHHPSSLSLSLSLYLPLSPLLPLYLILSLFFLSLFLSPLLFQSLTLHDVEEYYGQKLCVTQISKLNYFSQPH